MITEQQLINNDIFEKENFLTADEATDLFYLANTCAWQYGGVSNSFSDQKQSRMTHRIDMNKFNSGIAESQKWSVYSVWKRLEGLFDFKVKPCKIYINYADHATVNLPHCDGTDNGPSVLICLNQEWRRDWGGYTVFFKSMSSSKITKAFVPEPGKAIIFNGSNWHSGMPVAHFAPGPRYILTFHCTIG